MVCYIEMPFKTGLSVYVIYLFASMYYLAIVFFYWISHLANDIHILAYKIKTMNWFKIRKELLIWGRHAMFDIQACGELMLV